jgi:hypothetical protein
MLLMMAAVALTAFLIRDHYRVRDARVRYDSIRASWLAHRITLQNLVESSEELARAEADSPWIFRQLAVSRHIARMAEPIKYYEGGLSELKPEEEDRRIEYLRETIRQHQR